MCVFLFRMQVERRNRLRLLQPWLEAMVSTGNTETATHNAIGKIYVTLNKDPVTFLTNNQFYDPKVCVCVFLSCHPRLGNTLRRFQCSDKTTTNFSFPCLLFVVVDGRCVSGFCLITFWWCMGLRCQRSDSPGMVVGRAALQARS